MIQSRTESVIPPITPQHSCTPKTVGLLMQVDGGYTNADGTQVAPRNLNPGGSA